jgi:hypothetical protein
VPHYGPVQFFRWKGYWMEVSRLQDDMTYPPSMGDFESIHSRSRHSHVNVITLSLRSAWLLPLVWPVSDLHLQHLYAGDFSSIRFRRRVPKEVYGKYVRAIPWPVSFNWIPPSYI